MQRFESVFIRTFCSCALFAGVLLFGQTVKANDGYRLWLRYEQLPSRSVNTYRQRIKSIAVQGKSATFAAIQDELTRGCAGLLGTPVIVEQDRDDASLVIGLPGTSSLIRTLRWDTDLKRLGPEGFRIRTVRQGNRSVIVIASASDTGALYGAFHFLRLLQTEQPIDRLQIDERPRLKLRVLNHWDNLDGSIERGYAGKSLWKWDELPQRVDARLVDYARANASIGINGVVLNSVNADSKIFTAEYLDKVAAIANVLRPYGIRVCSRHGLPRR